MARRGCSGTYTIAFYEYPRKSEQAITLGDRFGAVTAEAYLGMDSHRRCVYRFRCDCGRTFEALGTDMKRGRKTSCGFCEFGKKTRKRESQPSPGRRGAMATYDNIDPDDTLCWSCKHSHGAVNNQCEWAWELKPVTGWKAEKVMLKGHGHNEDFASYCVTDCPKYEREKRKEHSVRSAEYSDIGVGKLIDAFIKLAIVDYEAALKRLKKAYEDGETLMFMESDAMWDLWGFFYHGSPMINGIHLSKIGRLTERKMGMPEGLEERGMKSVVDLILEVDYKGEENGTQVD